MAEGLGMSLVVLFAFVSCVFHLTFCSAVTDDLERYTEALRENRVQLTALSKPTTSPLVQGRKPPDARILDLYCYENVEELNFRNLWTSVCFELSLKERRYEVYSGTNESHIFHLFEREATSWRSLFSYSSRHVCFSPYERACIGIDTVRSYKLNLVVQDFDSWLVGCTLCGVLLFLFASKLCRSTVFYYFAGISVGVLTSILVIFIIVGRMFTKKFTVMALSLAAGGSLTLWFMKWLWINLQMALEFYQEYLIGYLVCSALLSFAICYYYGPITNERLLDLMKWFLQGVAVLMVYSGIQFTGVSYTVIGLLFIDQVASFCWRHIRQ